MIFYACMMGIGIELFMPAESRNSNNLQRGFINFGDQRNQGRARRGTSVVTSQFGRLVRTGNDQIMIGSAAVPARQYPAKHQLSVACSV